MRASEPRACIIVGFEVWFQCLLSDYNFNDFWTSLKFQNFHFNIDTLNFPPRKILNIPARTFHLEFSFSKIYFQISNLMLTLRSINLQSFQDLNMEFPWRSFLLEIFPYKFRDRDALFGASNSKFHLPRKLHLDFSIANFTRILLIFSINPCNEEVAEDGRVHLTGKLAEWLKTGTSLFEYVAARAGGKVDGEECKSEYLGRTYWIVNLNSDEPTE